MRSNIDIIEFLIDASVILFYSGCGLWLLAYNVGKYFRSKKDRKIPKPDEEKRE